MAEKTKKQEQVEKTRKRGQGEGTISKRPDGTYWARITVGKTASGGQKRKAFYGKSRKEVQKKLTAALHDVNNNTYIEPSKMTVAQWIEVWYRDYKKNTLKKKTTMSYESYISVDIIPFVGTYKLCELRADILQKFVNDLLQKGLKPSTIERAFIILKSALQQAVSNELIVKNPATAVQLPKKEKREAKVLTIEEQERFVVASKDYYNGDMFVFILLTGLRIGEALVLTWDDVDHENKLLTVNKTQYYAIDNSKESFKHYIEIGTPKTQSSNRKIPLIPEAIEVLDRVRQRQERLKSDGIMD